MEVRSSMTKRLVVLLVAVAAMSSAWAQVANLDERLVNVQAFGPPVSIKAIHAGWEVPAWAAEAHRIERLPVGVLPLYLQVQSASSKTIVAYQVMVAVYDPFGKYIDTVRANAVVALPPQQADYGRWSLPLRSPDSAWTVVAYPSAVKFADGTQWDAPPEKVAAYVPSSAPVEFHSWHIVPDPREVLAMKMKDLMPQAQPAAQPPQ
jgi:hypothetical protein